MEITVGCHCGSKYTLEEETVNGRVKWPVTCPHCGGDGTNLANEYIQRMLSGDLERERKKNSTWWGRLFGGKTASAGAAAASEESDFRFGLGIAGAAVGAAAGLAAWYFIKRSTGFEVGYVAWGIGALVGFCARFAARGGSFGLAGVASLAAAAAILGGQFWTLHQRVEEHMRTAADVLYGKVHEFAEGAAKADIDTKLATLLHNFNFHPSDVTPGENPVLCQKWLMPVMGLIFRDVMKDGSAPSLHDVIDQKLHQPKITPADLAAFRKTDLPVFQAFLNGKPSQDEFDDALIDMTSKNLSVNNMMAQSWSKYTFLWIFLGVGTAWRLAYDKSETDFA